MLLDEVEKAHADVFQVFLQVLDDGRATDAQGRTVSFKNTLIIMTSNLGSGEIFEALGGPGGWALEKAARKKAKAEGAAPPAAPAPPRRAVVAVKAPPAGNGAANGSGNGPPAAVVAKRGPAPPPTPPRPPSAAAPASDEEQQQQQLNGGGGGGEHSDGGEDANNNASSSNAAANAAAQVYSDVKQRVMEAVRGHFRPEFVNRVDDFIVFHPLAADEIRAIVAMRAAALVARLKQQQRIELSLSDGARDAVARVGYDPVFGARPVKRALQRELQTPMALALLRGDFREGDRVVAEAADEPMPAAVEGGNAPFCVVGDGSSSGNSSMAVPTGSVGTALRLRLEFRPPAVGEQGQRRVAALREKAALAAAENAAQ